MHVDQRKYTMSNATRFARKPLVAAVLTTLAAFSVQAAAKDVTLTVGTGEDTVSATITNEQTWNESWAQKIDESFKNADDTVTINEGSDDANKSITITKGDSSSGKLTNSLSSLTLDVALDVKEDGSFVNTGNITTSKAVTVAGGFDNSKGTITAKEDVTINALTNASNLESAPAAIAMGDITLEGNGVVLTNNDTGYTLKSEEKDGKEGDTHARVTFGKVTLKNGASFKNVENAIDSGSSLTIASDAGASTIAGTSTWGTITAEKTNAVSVSGTGTLSADTFVIGTNVGTDTTIDGFVTGDGKFTINKGLKAETFANGGSLDLSSGKTGTLASGASLTLGKVQAFKQGDDGKITTDGDYHQGTVKISGHNATWSDAASTAADADRDETENKGAWDTTRFGDVTAFNNAQLQISGNKTSETDISTHGYTASLSFGNLTLANTSLEVTPSAKVETLTGFITTALAAVNDGVEADKQIKLDTSAWTKDDYAKNLEKFLGTLTEEQKTKFEESYNGSVDKLVKELAIDSITDVNVEHKIEGSDVAIGTLAFKSVESEVGASLPKTATTVVAEGDGGNTTEDRGSVALAPVTSVMGAQTLQITGSRVEVGSLSLADGTLNITNSDVIIAKTGTINGTLTAESGYLGLNVSTSMADRVAAQKKAADAGAASGLVVEVGGPVVLGEKAVVTFGTAGTSGSTGSGTATADAADQTGAKLTFAGNTTLKFDASRFNQSALFTAEGAKGEIKFNGNDDKIKLDGANLTWGAYKLFDNFDQSALEGKFDLGSSDFTASDAWKNQVGNNFTIKKNDNGEWIVVAGGTTVEGSGLNVGAKNLVSKLFSGDRASGADLQLVNSILSTGASLDEISSMINSVTGLGAISGVKAMTVDFQGYTADMIEHHAATSPKEMGGWWVQPMGARLKTDDLSMGGSAYGYSIDTIGIMGGFDAKLKNGWTVGAAASYQSGEADGEGDVLPVSTDVTNVGLHLWGSRMYGETNVIGTLSYVTTDGDATMQASGLELASELKAKALSAGVRAEREFKTGAFTLTPHAGARISIIDMDDYEIAAGETKLFDVSEDKATIFEVPVGVTVQTPAFMFQTFEVKPYVDLTVRGRFGDTESTYTLEGSSTTDSIDYDVSGSFVGDLKVGYMSTYKNLNLGMSYGLSAGDAGRQNHALEATLRVDF